MSEEFPKVDNTADIIVLRQRTRPNACQNMDVPFIEMLLIRRAHEPFEGCWAFPGGFLDTQKDFCLSDTAYRELLEETHIPRSAVKGFRQFRTYSHRVRDPRKWVITTVFLAGVSAETEAHADDDAAELKWFDINHLPSMAFDHADIWREVCEEWEHPSRGLI